MIRNGELKWNKQITMESECVTAEIVHSFTPPRASDTQSTHPIMYATNARL